MKKAIFFPLSSTHFTSTIAVNIRRISGLQGYALYLIIMQYLANTDERVLSFNAIDDIQFEVRTVSVENIKAFIDTYFQVKDGCFYSQELEDSLAYYDTKQAAASKGGKQSAANLTTEQRIERAKHAADCRYHSKPTSANDAKQT